MGCATSKKPLNVTVYRKGVAEDSLPSPQAMPGSPMTSNLPGGASTDSMTLPGQPSAGQGGGDAVLAWQVAELTQEVVGLKAMMASMQEEVGAKQQALEQQVARQFASLQAMLLPMSPQSQTSGSGTRTGVGAGMGVGGSDDSGDEIAGMVDFDCHFKKLHYSHHRSLIDPVYNTREGELSNSDGCGRRIRAGDRALDVRQGRAEQEQVVCFEEGPTPADESQREHDGRGVATVCRPAGCVRGRQMLCEANDTGLLRKVHEEHESNVFLRQFFPGGQEYSRYKG
jgi:hypothetical protein